MERRLKPEYVWLNDFARDNGYTPDRPMPAPPLCFEPEPKREPLGAEVRAIFDRAFQGGER